MRKVTIPKPLASMTAFIVLFLLSTFAASYRKSVQAAAIPVLPATIQHTEEISVPHPKPLIKKPPMEQALPPEPENQQSMEKVINTLSSALRPRLRRIFIRKGITYPPSSLTLIALKKERRLEIWSPDDAGNEHLVTTYPIFGESGTLGPKLHQGDLQVPEGFYKILWFNPDSEYYLSMKLNYPNQFDRRMAELDGRTDLGGDIFIHGYDVSLGCLAIGNPNIEELFLLVYDTGKKNTSVIITPYDFRKKDVQTSEALKTPLWTNMLYRELKEKMLLYTRRSSEDNAS